MPMQSRLTSSFEWSVLTAGRGGKPHSGHWAHPFRDLERLRVRVRCSAWPVGCGRSAWSAD